MSAGKGGIDMEIGGLTVRGRVAEAFDLAAHCTFGIWPAGPA